MQLVVFCSLFVALVYSHAAMTVPPARNAVGENEGACSTLYCKKNYDWMAANHGPKTGDWDPVETNICGDSQFILPGDPVETYTAGQVISITISVNAFHDGYYEFRLCVPNLVTDMPPSTNAGLMNCVKTAPLLKRVTPLEKIATYVNPQGPTWTTLQLQTRWTQTPREGQLGSLFRGSGTSYKLDYVLPSDVQCDHCVLHWYWQSLNSWQNGDATTTATTEGERFWNCADIVIVNPNGRAKGNLNGFLNGSPSPNSTPSPVSIPKSSPVPVPVPKPSPVPIPKSSPVPVPVPKPSPVPISNPSPAVGCTLSYAAPGFSEWWAAVDSPTSDFVVKCGDGTTRSCTFDAGWGKYQCSFNPSCPLPHTAVVGGTKNCPLKLGSTASATTTVTVGEESVNGQGDSVSVHSDNETPGWAIALLVLGSLTLVAFIALIAVVARSPSRERV